MKAICYFEPQSRRSHGIAGFMAQGIWAANDEAVLERDWDKFYPDADVAVAYGWGHPETFERYRAAGKAFVYIDLGWWWRKPDGMVMEGYHKVVVSGREPGPYFRRRSLPNRFDKFGLTIQPWRTSGEHILLAGMSEKSARTRGGWKPYEWEISTIAQIRKFTDRPILFRPKPSWTDARPIPGVGFSPATQLVEEALVNAWAVVTLHSNVAVDALIAGVPIHATEGVCTEFSTPIADIENPRMPNGREGLMADIAYQQWSSREMRSGECWRFLKEERLICG